MTNGGTVLWNGLHLEAGIGLGLQRYSTRDSSPDLNKRVFKQSVAHIAGHYKGNS
jgi:hypothetical protein